jgi:hypothetical protein
LSSYFHFLISNIHFQYSIVACCHLKTVTNINKYQNSFTEISSVFTHHSKTKFTHCHITHNQPASIQTSQIPFIQSIVVIGTFSHFNIFNNFIFSQLVSNLLITSFIVISIQLIVLNSHLFIFDNVSFVNFISSLQILILVVFCKNLLIHILKAQKASNHHINAILCKFASKLKCSANASSKLL